MSTFARTQQATGFRPVAIALALTCALAACRGGGEGSSANGAGASSAASAGSTATAGVAASGALPAPAPGQPPDGQTAAAVATGDSIFHGLAAGGLCQTCHGPDAMGTALAPPLVQGKWLTGDGTYKFIQGRVTTGMPTPTPPYPGPMLPMGGAQLSTDQINDVAAYVYSISRNKTQ